MKRKRRGPPKKAAAKKPTPDAPVNADEQVFLNFVEQNVDENGVSNNNGVCQVNEANDFSSSLSPFSSSSSDGGGSFHPSQDSGSSHEPATGGRHGRPPSMKATNNTPAISSRGVGSTVKGKRSIGRKELPSVMKASQDPRYKKAELQACLAVIKKIMQMDEAVSFCSPVDPIAQGIPDYFSVIDTPMDLGTICKNLENEVKYLNSDDVYKDVNYIWENCSKYNKKGDYIVYLMKRVKRNFLKHWIEAGLGSEMQRRLDSTPPSVHTMRQSRNEAMSVVDNMVNSYQPEPRVVQPSYAQPSSSLMPQYSQFHGGVVSNQTGPWHSYMPGPTLTGQRQEPSHLFPPMMNGPTSSQQQQPQLSSRYMWQPHQTTSHSQPQPAQSHFHTDTNNTGHQQSLRPTDYVVTHNGYVPRSSMDPLTNIVGQPQLQHRLSSHYQQDRSNLPQAAASVDFSSPGMPPVDGIGSSRKRSSAGARKDKQPVTPQVTTPEKKRTRGPTRCHWMEDLPEGHRIYVPINAHGQPIGSEAPKLSSFLGFLARDGKLAPLNYLSWKKMPESMKENMWQIMQTKFDIDPLCKNWFLKSLGHKWRKWKAKLKADHFTPHATDEERLKDCDKRVYPDQWAALVAHWNSEEAQKRALINKANSSKQVNMHASGSKSFARIQEEEKAKRGGKELSRGELYILTRTRKDGKPVDDFAAEKIEKLREAANRKEQNSGDSSDQADTFCEVMGKETGTHVRMFGFGGPTIAELYGRKPSSSVVKGALESANEKIDKMMSKMEAMEEKYSSLEAQVGKMNSNMEFLIEKMGFTVLKPVRDDPPEDSLQEQSHSASASGAVEVEAENV